MCGVRLHVCAYNVRAVRACMCTCVLVVCICLLYIDTCFRICTGSTSDIGSFAQDANKDLYILTRAVSAWLMLVGVCACVSDIYAFSYVFVCACFALSECVRVCTCVCPCMRVCVSIPFLLVIHFFLSEEHMARGEPRPMLVEHV